MILIMPQKLHQTFLLQMENNNNILIIIIILDHSNSNSNSNMILIHSIIKMMCHKKKIIITLNEEVKNNTIKDKMITKINIIKNIKNSMIKDNTNIKNSMIMIKDNTNIKNNFNIIKDNTIKSIIIIKDDFKNENLLFIV